MNKEEILSHLKKYSQEHLIQFWDELNEDERKQLWDDIKEIDFEQLSKDFCRVQSEMNEQVKEIDLLMKPVPSELKGSFAKSNVQQLREYEMEGLRAIANNEVAVILLASGQGTRLGVTYPKGMFSVNLLSGKTLFQLQAERLIKIKQLADKKFSSQSEKSSSSSSIPWYIMSSDTTKEYFKSQSYFGLNENNVVFFEQYMLPCLTNDGKVILDQKHKISKAPDGNGGLYKALFKRHILDDMKNRGIKYVHVYCVDNILVKMADPTFIGFCIKKDANCAAKVVKKIDPEEKVGVICKVNDRFQVVEYSEITEQTRNLRDIDNDLVYNAGNICNHFFNTQFLNELCKHHETELKHHVAHKKIPFVNENGQRTSPKSNNGIKLEKFVFDVFPFSTNFAIWEVEREDEFSPLKNADDAKKECPTTCRNELYSQHFKWLKQAGALFEPKIEMSNLIDTVHPFEISPLVSYNGEGLEELVNGKVLRVPLKIELDQETSEVKFNSLDMETYEKQNILMGA